MTDIKAKANAAIDRALLIVASVFGGRVDKAGRPAVLHSIRVGMFGLDDDQMIVGFLHDVLEEEPIFDLRYSGDFTDYQIEAVKALTRKKGETYDHYLDRVCTNRLAAQVKTWDVLDNLNRLHELSKEQQGDLKSRYQRALRKLKRVTATAIHGDVLKGKQE